MPLKELSVKILLPTEYNSIIHPPMDPKPKKRGAVTKAGSQLVAVWLPNDLCQRLDAMVRAHDTDRSKLIRKAIREHAAA